MLEKAKEYINKLKEYVKKDWKYILITLIFMVLTTLIVTVNCSPGNDVVDINGPFENAYVTISYILIFIVGGVGAFLIRKADEEKVKLEKLYLLIAIPIGIIMCLNTPMGRIPDEDDHAKKAMAIAQGNFFSVADEDGNAIDMINSKVNELVSRTTETYEESWEKMNLAETEEKVKMKYNTMALYAPICHTPQAVGILIARIFGIGITGQCYAGRLFNFAVALTLIYNAIRLMPFKKYLLMYILLLPVAFNVLPTLSSDALTIAMSSFYIAYILHLKYNDDIKELSKKTKVGLVISTIVISLCKIVYVPLCLLLFLIPKEKFGSLKKKNIFAITTIIVAAILNLIWLAYCSRFLIEFNGGVNSKEQVMFILTHPIQYMIILFRTINFHFNIYYAGLSGDALGTYCVKASEIFIYSAIVITSMLFFTNKEDKNRVKIDVPTRLICSIVFVGIVVLIYTSLYVQWTPLKSTFINGVQARYFLPILFLVAIIIDNDKIIIKENINRFILTFLLFFNLNVATATIYTYYFGTLIDAYLK